MGLATIDPLEFFPTDRALSRAVDDSEVLDGDKTVAAVEVRLAEGLVLAGA